MAPPPYPPSHSPYNKSFVGVSTTSGVSSSSPALLQDRLENLFEDIKHFLALAPEKIPSIRREEFYKRALRLIGKLDTYANDDTVVDQLEKAHLKLIREYRTKLDIRANRLLETSSSLEVKKKIEQKKNASPMMVNGGEKEEEEPAKEVKKDEKDESASSVYQASLIAAFSVCYLILN